MSLSSHAILLSGLVDVRERFLRLLIALAESTPTADKGSRAVVSAMAEGVHQRLLEHAQSVQSQLTIATVAYGPAPAAWPPETLLGLADVGARGFQHLSQVHVEIAQHLPLPATPREDLRFLLFRALGLSLMSATHEELVAVSFSSLLTWESKSFPGKEHRRTAAVTIPFVETVSPLRWPLVVHELGHYLLPGGHDGVARIETAAASLGWHQDVLEEIVADAVAQRWFGDAYAFALAREGYWVAWEKHAPNNLTVAKRLELLGGPSDLLANLPTQWRLGAREDEEGSVALQIDDATLGQMREHAMSLVGDAQVNDARRVEMARALLRQGEPCPGVLSDSTAGTRIAAALAQVTAGTAVEDPLSVLETTVHTPLTDGEIFEAAWREEVEVDVDGVLEKLLAIPETATLEAERRRVADRDVWLARSLQSAAVHRWLLEYGERSLAAANK